MLPFVRMTSFGMRTYCFERKFYSSLPPWVPVKIPSKKETHLWYVLPDEVKSESLLNQYMEFLSPCEKENVFSMDGDELRKRALLARALIRTTIAKYQINFQVNPRSLKFRKSIHGKPEVDWQYSDDWHPPPLHFNISHTSSLIACGVTVASPIGIDVEEKQRRTKNNILSFARRYFSSYEVEFLNSISDYEIQRQEFIKLWTLKEAYVKALGKGFSGAPFNTFTIQFSAASNGAQIFVESHGDPTLANNWQFSLLELSGSHYAAICVENDDMPEGKESIPRNLTVWKTIPLVEDKCVSGTDAVVAIGGLT